MRLLAAIADDPAGVDIEHLFGLGSP